jgi:hypothetical protein|tara:strand:- start:55 stop:222 length:168 start_codon:yes stop_codon:yes gene_type:complete
MEPMSKLQRLKERALNNPDVLQEYKALEQEFERINEQLVKRRAEGPEPLNRTPNH